MGLNGSSKVSHTKSICIETKFCIRIPQWKQKKLASIGTFKNQRKTILSNKRLERRNMRLGHWSPNWNIYVRLSFRGFESLTTFMPKFCQNSCRSWEILSGIINVRWPAHRSFRPEYYRLQLLRPGLRKSWGGATSR